MDDTSASPLTQSCSVEEQGMSDWRILGWAACRLAHHHCDDLVCHMTSSCTTPLLPVEWAHAGSALPPALVAMCVHNHLGNFSDRSHHTA